uniref:Adaptive response protein AidB N-terminal domain-containing protein n=1 Tax=Panagrolaimus davidi TaxID=227884 RepID=A0A914Q6F8_9BILA
MSSSDYKHAKTGKFTQPSPILENPFTSDPILSRALKRLLPQQEYVKVSNDLTKFGERIVNEVDKLGNDAEIQPPQIQQFDAWGNRIDKLIVAPAWNRLKEISAEEGLIAIGYDKSVDPEYRRLHQMSKLYMFHPASGLVTCPLAMTDGAAKTISVII